MLIGNDIDRAIGIVKNGGVIAYPTETVYGVGGLATDAGAISRIYEIKGRPLSQPLSIAVSSMDMLKGIAKVECEDFILKFLPGPVTVILKKKKVLPDILTAGSKYVGIRWPDHHYVLDGGKCKYSAPSTIVDLHECTIVRKGARYEDVRRYLFGCGCATED